MNLSQRREIDLWQSWLCLERGSAAFDDDFIEAALHEIGHVLCAEGIKRAEVHRPYDVDMFCDSLRYPDRNEYDAIAFTFLVCRVIEYPIDEYGIIEAAAVSLVGVPGLRAPRGMAEKQRGVERSIRSPKVNRIAAEFVRLIEGT